VAKRTTDLREDCVAEALAIIAQDGVEKLSLREVARRLGVSHQAPYKHFPSRDHILAEIVARAFADFARSLDARPVAGDPDGDMGHMGRAYLDYARSHPLEYRLMFGTPLPAPDRHPAMMKEAKHAFSLLCDALERKAAAMGRERTRDEIVLDALFIWSGLHGLASILASSTVTTLGLDRHLLEESRERLLRGFQNALEAGPAGRPGRRPSGE
jgi:AcrR family transcriptional regulator